VNDIKRQRNKTTDYTTDSTSATLKIRQLLSKLRIKVTIEHR